VAVGAPQMLRDLLLGRLLSIDLKLVDQAVERVFLLSHDSKRVVGYEFSGGGQHIRERHVPSRGTSGPYVV